MPMIEIGQETYDLLVQAAPFQIMQDRETGEFVEALPEDLANAIIWQAAQNILRKHRDEGDSQIGPLPDEMDDNIPF